MSPHYKEGGLPSISPGIYFRIFFIGYFEGTDGQRGIALRFADCLSLREFPGAATTDATPAFNLMTLIRQLLSEGAFGGFLGRS